MIFSPQNPDQNLQRAMQIRASDKAKFFQVQRNLDLVTLNLVTACDLKVS